MSLIYQMEEEPNPEEFDMLEEKDTRFIPNTKRSRE